MSDNISIYDPNTAQPENNAVNELIVGSESVLTINKFIW